MIRNKKILILALLLFGLLLIPTIANAAETFTTTDGIVATKIVENTDGTIDFKFTNISLSAEGQYEWGIGTTSNSEDITKWYTLGDFNESNKSAILSLTPSISSIQKILRTTNTAWLYIKDVKNDSYLVDALKVDLTLPVLKAFKIVQDSKEDAFRQFDISTVYDIDNLYYKFEKITDEKVINEYKMAIKNNKELSSISSLAPLSKAPETGWKTMDSSYATINNFYINKGSEPKEAGVYYLWIKGKDTDSKTIIGYTIIGIDTDGPTVESIRVISPAAGTYKTGQTVKINVYFSEVIEGSTVPTLKIRFGDSEVRTISTGTIINESNNNNSWVYAHYVQYLYNIQASDKGQLATVELTGGNIKDVSGNVAKLSCPVITGNVIKANVEGTVTNNTDNQDKTNNNTTNTNTNTNNNTNGTTNNSTNTKPSTNGTTNNSTNTKPSTNATTNKTDTTTAPSKIPQTGESVMIIAIIATVIGIGAYACVRYNRYKGI